jgi:DNA-binding response OmpR family regulator
MKKFFVDDEPNSNVTRIYFQENNFEVFIARDGQEALDIKLQLPDIIILDVMMPMVDGFATLEQIKQDKRLQHCKVIFLSAKNKEKTSKGLSLRRQFICSQAFLCQKN